MSNYLEAKRLELNRIEADLPMFTNMMNEFKWDEIDSKEAFYNEVNRVFEVFDYDIETDFYYAFVDFLQFETAYERCTESIEDGVDLLNASMWAVGSTGQLDTDHEHDDRKFTLLTLLFE